MKCPICDFEYQGDGARCPSCQTTLTTWINQNNFSEAAYAGGLHALKEGDRETAAELLLKACVSSPESPRCLAAYGRVLAQCGRYQEAVQVLEKAQQVDPSEQNDAALQRATALAQAPPPATPILVDEQSDSDVAAASGPVGECEPEPEKDAGS